MNLLNATNQIKKTVIYLFFCTLTLSAFAVNDTTITVNLCYPDDKSSINNVILSNLSQSLPTIKDKPCLTYKLSFNYEITATNIRTFYRNVKVESIVVYQRFSIRELLMPVDLTITVSYFNNKLLIEKQDVKQVISQDGLLCNYQIPQGKTINRVEITIKKFDLSPLMLDKIIERQQIIDEYYSADIQLKLVEEDLKKIKFDQTDNSEQYQEITKKSLTTVSRIKAKNFEQSLFLNEYDPVKLISRLNAISSQSISAQKKLVVQIPNIEREYYKSGVTALQKKDTVSALRFFYQAIDAASDFALPYIKLADIEIDKNNFPEAIRLIHLVDKNTVLDSLAVIEASTSLNNIINNMLDDVKLTRLQGNFDEAMLQLDECYELCSSISFYTCSGLLDIEKKEIISAIFAKIVKQIEIHLNKRKYDDFLMIVDSAYQYQILYSVLLKNRELLFKCLNASYSTLVAYGEKTMDINVSAAIDALMTSKKLCQKYREVTCKEEANALLKTAFTAYYDQMIEEAFLLFNAQHIASADTLQRKAESYCIEQDLNISKRHIELQHLIYQYHYNTIIDNIINERYADCNALKMADSATTLLNRYKLKETGNELTAYRKAVQKCCYSIVGIAEKCLITKDFNGVISNLDRAINLKQKYNVDLDPELERRIIELRDLLFIARCQKSKFYIDIQLKSADSFQSKKEFPFAVNALKNAAKLVEKDTECGFGADDIKERIKYLTPISQYQTDYEKIYDYIQEHKFDKAISQISKIEKVYSDSLLIHFEIERKSFLSIVIEYDYIPFTIAVAEYLAEEGYYEESLELLNLLYSKNIESHLTKKIQENLGRNIAARDKEELQNDDDKKDAVYKYINNDTKWFRTFVKTYHKNI